MNSRFCGGSNQKLLNFTGSGFGVARGWEGPWAERLASARQAEGLSRDGAWVFEQFPGAISSAMTGLFLFGMNGDLCYRVGMTIKDGEFIEIETPSGTMRMHLFRPVAGGRYPAIVLFSEIFQVTGPIRRTAALLAGNGFLVAVPEIYHEYEPAGTVLAYDTAGADRGNALKTTKPLDAYDSDARAAIACLESHPASTGRIGVMGMCIGGHLAFRAAMNRQVLAAACLYPTDIHKRGLGKGMNDDTLDRIPEIRGELLLIFGRQDPHVSLEGRLIIHAALEQAGVRFQWHEVNGAHAFIRDEGPRFDPVLAHQAYSLAIEMFHRRLGEGDEAGSAGAAETRH